jgi:hypothetical protein
MASALWSKTGGADWVDVRARRASILQAHAKQAGRARSR